jgi:hypothetical protein
MRDEFKQSVRNAVAARVGHRCSNPDCGAVTSGPGTTPGSTVNVGVAAHITAASPGGARFDPTLSNEERAAASNGIWTCQTCAKLIDSDVEAYPVDLLRRWKAEAEGRADRMLRARVGSLSEPLDLAVPALDSEKSLLSYANTSVGQIGRTQEMSDLLAFLEDEQQFSWWLWTGAAGTGKSRLAVELCRSVSGTWHAGFLRESDQSGLSELQTIVPTLIVVDYAAQRSIWLSDTLFRLTQRDHAAPVRLLVLEREAAGPWWDTVQRHHRLEEASHVAAASYALPRVLTGLDHDDLRALIASAARRLGSDLSRTAIEDVADHALRIDPSGRPLFALIATMDSLTDDLTGGRSDALRRLIAREQSQLTRRIAEPASASRAQNLRTLATMVGGLSIDDYSALVEASHPPVELLPRAYEDLHGVSLDELLNGMRPDILGELLVLDQFEAGGVTALVAKRLRDLAWSASPDAYKAFIDRAAGDYANHNSFMALLDLNIPAAPHAWAALAADMIPLLQRSGHPLVHWILERLGEFQNLDIDKNLGEVVTTARFRFGNALLFEGNVYRANEVFTELIDTADPSWSVHADILNNRGITWLELAANSDLAVKDFTSVINAPTASNEARACALNNRADIFDLENPAAAISDRTAVLALSDTTYNRRFIALIRRARALWTTGNRSRAHRDIDAILATDDIAIEQKMAARLQRAEWLVEEGATSDALSDLEVVLVSNRNFEEVEARARRIMKETGQTQAT